jgi:hypothetical protein
MTLITKIARLPTILLLTIVVLLASVLLGCSANDPLTDPLYTEDSFIRINPATGSGGYWHEYSIGAIDLSPGASGATQIAPNASSLGGYQFNAINEYIYFDSHIDHDWDGVSDGVLDIFFEVNDDNSGGLVTDTVKIQLEVWHKIEGELTCTVYSLQGNTVVGQSQQHELFEQKITVGNLRERDILSFRINLNTIQSQVTDIIVNYVEFKYPTFLPQMEES